MKQNNEVSKKVAKAEITIILGLIAMWLLVWAVMTAQRSDHIDRMLSLQSQILDMFTGQLTADNTDIDWSFSDSYRYFIIKNQTIIDTNVPRFEKLTLPGTSEAFENAENTEGMLDAFITRDSGSDWIQWDRIGTRYWVTWEADESSPYITGVISDEKALLELSGFKEFRIVLLVCAGLGSALILLALIWALSWIRISAIKGLDFNKR